MHCRICGDERDVFRAEGNRGYLCKTCLADTPRKVSRETFYREYFNSDNACPEAVKSEFYDDYRASEHTLSEYMKATTRTIL